MSPAEVLALAADKLEIGWTTRAGARDAAGRETAHFADRACSWCSIGAIFAVEADLAAAEVARGAYATYLTQRFGVPGSVADWNDNHCPDQATAVATMRAAAESFK